LANTILEKVLIMFTQRHTWFTLRALLWCSLTAAALLAACAPNAVPPNTPPALPTNTASPASTPDAPDPVMPALNDTPPEACRVSGQELYVNPYDGYCFAYPSNFELKMSQTGQPELYGPALDQNLDALRAVLNIEVQVAVQNASLTQIVDDYLKQFASLDVPPIARTSITFGGEPAEQLEVVPGLAGSRDIFVLHNGTLYHVLFMPSIRDYPQAKADVEELYKSVTTSFSLTSKKPRPLPTP
jgi:hypothetical protein